MMGEELNMYWGLDLALEPVDPMKMRLEMAMSRGFEMIAPKFIMPQFTLEPFTDDELRQIYVYKRANVSKLRNIIRNASIHKRRRLP